MKKGGVSESEKPAESYMQFMTRMHRDTLKKFVSLVHSLRHFSNIIPEK